MSASSRPPHPPGWVMLGVYGRSASLQLLLAAVKRAGLCC